MERHLAKSGIIIAFMLASGCSDEIGRLVNKKRSPKSQPTVAASDKIGNSDPDGSSIGDSDNVDEPINSDPEAPIAKPIPKSDKPIPKPTATFDVVMNTILKPACLPCHSDSHADHGNEIDLSTYDLVTDEFFYPVVKRGSPADSLIYQLVKSGKMPPGSNSLPADKVELLERWIKAGAPR